VEIRFLPAGNRGLVQSTSFQYSTEKIAEGEDLIAAGAPPAELEFAAHEIAVAATPFAQEAFVA